MKTGTIRSWSVALSVVAAMGLSQHGMATTTTGTEAASEEEDRSHSYTLEALSKALADALATLKYIEEQLAALKEARAEADRKLLALPLPRGLSRSTESPVYSVGAGQAAIAAAEEAVAVVQEESAQVEIYIPFLETEIQRVEAAIQSADCVTPCAQLDQLQQELAILQVNLEAARADLAAAQTALAQAEAELARQIDNPGVLATLLSHPETRFRFAPLSAAIERNFGESRSALSDDARIKAISSDGANGFHVTYVIDGAEQTVHFEAGEYTSTSRSYRKQDGSALLWSYTNSFRRSDGNYNQGSTEFRYFDAHGSWVHPGYQVFLTYGARTEERPPDAATYAGRMSGDSYPRDNPSRNTGRSLISARLNLTADFESGTIGGRINRIFVRPPGATNYAGLPYTTRFDIENGRIGDGQFTATLTGVDTNPDASGDQTVLGYEGDILGEFYGPAAEEVGGVLNAVSEDHDAVLSGWFGGRQLRSVVPEGASSPPSSSGVERNQGDSTVQAADDSGVTAIASDGEGGFNVTYTIDGVEHAVHMEGRHYGADPRYGTTYAKETDTHRYYIWSQVGSFFGRSEYDHFDVIGWVGVRSGDDTNEVSEFSARGFAVHGARTDADGLPAGEAIYSGQMRGEISPSDDPEGSSRSSVIGDLSLTADFAASTISGMIDGIETRSPGESSYRTSTEVLTLAGGTIADSAFTADLTGAGDEDSRYEGDVSGQFFGPAAEEVGGVLQATHTGDDTVLTGWFGGKRDERAETTPAPAE